MRDLCYYLDRVLDKNKTEIQVESLPFRDVHENYDIYSIDIEKLKQEPICKDELDGFLKSLNLKKNESQQTSPFLASVYRELGENLTKRLVKNCKLNGCTIQAALSTALALSLLSEKIHGKIKNITIKNNSKEENERCALKEKLFRMVFDCNGMKIF